MLPDENYFFRDISDRLITGKTPGASLHEGLLCLKRVMPADMLYLSLFDPQVNKLKIIAIATADGAEEANRVLPLNDRSSNFILDPENSGALILDSVVPPFNAMIAGRDLKWNEYSAIALRLKKREISGLISVLAKGNHRYSPSHMDLFILLRLPAASILYEFVQAENIDKLKSEKNSNVFDKDERRNLVSDEEIIGDDAGLTEVVRMARQVANYDSPVILLGETGVGKEMVARLIHSLSPRRNFPFVPVNCGAIPETLIDSLLFGHEKGSFTGATSQKKGVFELADKGTVFLDEIGELPLNAQTRMLRVLQEKRVQRVGGVRQVNVDIRVIAATHQNLDEMISQKKFRSDLWFRLHVFTISIPPLRERKSDIPLLVTHFLVKKARQLRIPVFPGPKAEAIAPLMAYEWPGNVRELENVVERALILGQGRELPFHRIVLGGEVHNLVSFSPDAGENLKYDHVSAQHIQKVLKITNGKINGPGGAAKRLGIPPSTLRNRMDRLGIPYGKDKF